MRLLSLTTILLALAACSESDPPSSEAGGAGAANTGTGGQANQGAGPGLGDGGSGGSEDAPPGGSGSGGGSDGGSADALPDVRDQMSKGEDECEEVVGSLVAGAKRYFWGEYYQESNSTFVGTEAEYFLANDTWIEAGGADCQVVWTTTAATQADTGACTQCDIAIEVEAEIDLAHTTCPEALFEDAETWSETYSIEKASGGAANFYFYGNGDQFGAGYWSASALNYLSTPSCNWF